MVKNHAFSNFLAWIIISLPIIFLTIFIVFIALGEYMEILLNLFFASLILILVIGIGRLIWIHLRGNIKKYDLKKMHKEWSDGVITVYAEGLRYSSYFVEWKDVKSIHVYPVSGNLLYILALLLSINDGYSPSANAGNYIIRISYGKKKLLAETYDKKGFFRALTLLKKNDLVS
jgi:hypothetical protein